MCSVSMVGDHYRDMWKDQPWITAPNVPWNPLPGQTVPFVGVSVQEFNDLKRQVEEMKELLKRAKKYDEDNGEPDCEMDEKMDLLRRVAKLVGVDIETALKGQANV